MPDDRNGTGGPKRENQTVADDELETSDETEAANDGGQAEPETDWKAEADKWKALSKKNEAQAKANAAAAKRAKELDEAGKSEVEKARAEARDQVLAEVLKDRALDRVEAKAAKLFADPEDARALLAPHVDDLIDDGKVDAAAIDKALADLLKRKPHLGTDQRRFKGSADGGARGSSAVTQVTEHELKRMTPEQIVKAREEGRLADLL